MQIVTEMDLPEMPVERPSFAADPMPYAEAARKKHPWLAKFHKGYVIHGYQATKDVLAMDEKMFVNFEGVVEHFDAKGTDWGRFMVDILPTQSGPKHTRLRASVAMAFTPRRANQTRPAMKKVISELLDEWAPKGAFDFTEFAAHFPITVMCGLLGVSAATVPRIHHALETQVEAMSLNRDLKPKLLEAYDILWGFADNVVNERDKSGTVDDASLLDALIACKNRGDLDDRELRYMLMVLLLAGYDTSKNLLTMLTYTLIQNPEMWEKCAQDLSYCTKVVDEICRIAAIASPYRRLGEEIQYEGVLFPKDTVLFFAMPIAGCDPKVYADPLKFQPERVQDKDSRHLAFGRGIHICLGQHLAKAQIEEGIHLIAQRLRKPRVAGEVTWRPFPGIWGLRTLPIAFDA
jgi:cytochrome P450